jgi:hypothetical protein
MKIAICFSGQIRTGVETAPNILRYIGDLLPNCDFFVHTWDIETYSTEGFSSTLTDDKNILPQQLSPINVDIYHKFVKIYTPAVSVLDSFSLWSKSRHGEHNRKIYLPHQYSVYISNKLKFMYEEMNNFVYDFVIRIRPDIMFDSDKSLIHDLKLVSDSRTLCYAQFYDEAVINNNIHNGFWLGSSYVMDQVTDFYNIMSNKNESIDEHIHFGNWVIMGLMFNTVKLKNSKVGVYRQFHKDLNIDPSDYGRISQITSRKMPK